MRIWEEQIVDGEVTEVVIYDNQVDADPIQAIAGESIVIYEPKK